jgi:60 kDa SS-A/Ro ribonucleoprotein
MASVNKRSVAKKAKTFEGAVVVAPGNFEELKRTVLNCLLFEDTFYEKGSTVAQRIKQLVPQCAAADVAALAVDARERFYLRHVGLFLVRELARVRGNGPLVAKTLEAIVQRPDELTEYVALYLADGKKPLSAGSKRGLRKAFAKFSPYSLAKYQERDKTIKLVDVLRMVRPKPLENQVEAFKALRAGELRSFDTWETELSAGKDKKETFAKLLSEGKLGGLATLRNLRNMKEAGVPEKLIRERLKNGEFGKVFPYRFVTAAKIVPSMEDALEVAMFKALEGVETLPGVTGLLIDVSGSMDAAISAPRPRFGARAPVMETTRVDVAAGLAILLREKAEVVKVATFSSGVVEVAPRRGFALRDAIHSSQPHSATYLKRALETLKVSSWNNVDRVIVITDEQSADGICSAWTPHAYVINVAPHVVGVSTRNSWTHVDGWSERVFDYIAEVEKFAEVTR